MEDILLLYYCHNCDRDFYFEIDNLPGREEHCEYCEYCYCRLSPVAAAPAAVGKEKDPGGNSEPLRIGRSVFATNLSGAGTGPIHQSRGMIMAKKKKQTGPTSRHPDRITVIHPNGYIEKDYLYRKVDRTPRKKIASLADLKWSNTETPETGRVTIDGAVWEVQRISIFADSWRTTRIITPRPMEEE